MNGNGKRQEDTNRFIINDHIIEQQVMHHLASRILLMRCLLAVINRHQTLAHNLKFPPVDALFGLRRRRRRLLFVAVVCFSPFRLRFRGTGARAGQKRLVADLSGIQITEAQRQVDNFLGKRILPREPVGVAATPQAHEDLQRFELVYDAGVQELVGLS